MVLQIQTRQPGVLPAELLFLHKGFHEPELGDPIELPDQLLSITGQQSQCGSPFAQNPIRLRIGPGQMFLRREIILFLNIQACNRAAVLLADRRLQILIARQLLHCRDRLFQLKHRSSPSRDQLQGQLRRPDFQGRSVFAHIGIANDEMEPPILLPHRMGLVPRIQNRPVMHRINAQIRLHKVGPLRELIGTGHKSALLPLHPHFACSRNNLSADQKGQQPGGQRRKGNRT